MVNKKVVIGNWKMELSHKGELEVGRAFKKLVSDVLLKETEVVVCPSYPSLGGVKEIFKGSEKVKVGAQNVHWEESGAWTGQVSVSQLSQFVDWCIVGHSEQRALTGESDEEVEKKTRLLIRHGITPVACVGETLEEREEDKAVEKITKQVQALIKKASRTEMLRIVIAYEPIWAIGTGQTPDPADVAGVMLLIRKVVAAKYGHEAAKRWRILYGGSVTPENVGLYIREPGVGGVLVGGASIRPIKFLAIIRDVEENKNE